MKKQYEKQLEYLVEDALEEQWIKDVAGILNDLAESGFLEEKEKMMDEEYEAFVVYKFYGGSEMEIELETDKYDYARQAYERCLEDMEYNKAIVYTEFLGVHKKIEYINELMRRGVPWFEVYDSDLCETLARCEK